MVALQKAEGGSAPWACAPKIEIIELSGATCAQNGAWGVAKSATRGPERFAYRVGDKSHGPFFPIRMSLGDMLGRKPCRYLAHFVTFARRFPAFSSAFPLFRMPFVSPMREESVKYSWVFSP